MKQPKKYVEIDIDRIIDLCEQDDNLGICRSCGEEAYGVEPDARRYKCESCGARSVYGAEELLVMVAG